LQYHDFILHIGPDQGQGYPVHVSSPAGRGSALFQLPPGLETEPHPGAAGTLRHIAPVEGGSGESDAARAPQGPPPDPRELGDRLFRALFTGRVRNLFDQSWGRVQSSGEEGLRIQIRLDPEDASTGRLASLPWELLYQEETRQFLNLSRKSPVSRDLVVPRPALPLVFPSPLNLLAVTVNPQGTDTLELDKERKNLEAALRETSTVEVDLPQVSTAAELRRELRRKPYHVLHFMGHGDFDGQRGEGQVLFEDERGGLDPVPAQDFADELRDCESLRLVVLNACSTGRWGGDGADPFGGVALALILSGLPAVLAMQVPISDEAAIAFSQELYQHLAEGDAVDTALVEGRLAIHRLARASGLGSEWATPVLFLRSGTGIAAASTGTFQKPEATRGPEEPSREVQPTPPAAQTAPSPEASRARGLKLAITLTLTISLGGTGWVVFRPFSGPSPPEDSSSEQEQGGDAVVPPPAPTGPDIQALQKAPYQDQAFSTYILLPAAAPAGSGGWRESLERCLEQQMGSLHVQLTHSLNAAWMVVVFIESARVSAQPVGKRSMRRCDLEAKLEIYRQQVPASTEPYLSATATAFTDDRACDAAIQKLADSVGRGLQAAYSSS